MSDLTNVFTDIADAIRAKTETQITYKPTEMANAINNIETGGGALVYDANGVPFTNWFNSPVTIAEGVTSTAEMFSNCYNFNQPVIIPNSVIRTASMFHNCYNFNQPITIPNSVTNVYCMFLFCHRFNQPITIPDSITNIPRMFANCDNFNQPITIPNSVTSTFGMFTSCRRFNQPITIPDSVTDIQRMFSGCYNFNQPVTIPSNVTSTFFMLENCRNFNQPVIIPNSITSIAYMFVNCSNLRHVFVKTNPSLNIRNMVANTNNALQLIIETDNADKFTGTASANSITGKAMTWTQDGDNYYNTAYNIYIHNVAEPYVVLNNASYNFNDSSPLPDSPAIVFGSGVRSLEDAFSSVVLNSNNTLILFEEGIEELDHCFADQTEFNQPLTIPSSAVYCTGLLAGCSNFNSPVVFRNGVESILRAIADCQNFEANIWLPESVISMAGLLEDTPYASGTVHISHNIALGNTDNYIFNSLVNGHIGPTIPPERILNDY